MENEKIRILLVEDNKDFAKLVQVYLTRFNKDQFDITWKENFADTFADLDSGKQYDIILMDYFLPGKNGLEITRELRERKVKTPIVFLTVNKDFDLAVDVMKLGVDDYLVKEEISSPVLPKTVVSVVDKHRLTAQLDELEVNRRRIQAIHDTLSNVLRDFEMPLTEMRSLTTDIRDKNATEALKNYIKIIDENVDRIIDKLEKLKTLKVARTVKYIKDIKMLDLS
jgi:DNA-binding response OmpR family regulator